MRNSDPYLKAIQKIVEEDPRFHKDVYFFMQDAVAYTLELLNKQNKHQHKHITGQQLCEGIRKYFLDKFGPMAIDVLKEWRITQTRDFGIIVFNMAKYNVLSTRKEDSMDDFENIYDFHQEFVARFLPNEEPVTVPLIA